MTTNTSPHMTAVQRERLRELSKLATHMLYELHQAQIHEELNRVGVLSSAYVRADAAYQRALRLKGFVVGDLVKVVADGLYLGVETRILELETNAYRLSIDGKSVLAKPGQIDLVEAAE